ncbi:putative RNA polymerase II subunit B1 CTD phosphatase RPAP2 [Coccinella septempunctata]|uniref:putative RNA polymerase II subunit B1 CTD phosphatase RPAP2 n=1 Tax=Coccinella septempunctata TaxID=41139 RepID=UPI001D07FFD8|nr:putative RNA polymerase II subunit B1 CTD phosphatase RPAP2 [Coccinella septempunctata]
MEHDSLEDYLTLSEKIEGNGISKVKSLLTTAQKRQECERKALGIVQLFLERSVSADLFLKSLVYLNPEYYEDIAEERALLMLCGYPLCRKKISKPKCRYKISNKSKKVYDLNEYGNFCSIFCFNASNHIKSQILDSPLWLRDLEDVPTFNLLLKKVTQSAAGVNIKSKKIVKNEEFTTISSFAKLSLDDVGDIDFSVSALDGKQKINTNEKPGKKANKSQLSTLIESSFEEKDDVNDKLEESAPCDKSKNNPETLKSEKECMVTRNNKEPYEKNLSQCETYCKDENIRNISDEVNKPRNLAARGNDHILKGNRPKNKKGPTMDDLSKITNKIKSRIQKSTVTMIDALPLNVKSNEVTRLNEKYVERKKELLNNKSLIELKFSLQDSGAVENTLRSVFNKWITLETLLLIHGEAKIKEILDENKLTEHFEKLKISQLEIDHQKKYVSICRRLCEQEIFEEKIESQFLENKLKPLPDYHQLKRESKEFDIKVKTFLNGDLHESKDKNFGPVKTDQTGNTEEETSFIPLAHQNSQNALRQKILSETLNKSLQFLLDYISYDSTYVLTDLKDLIRTFKLDAENIVFKPVIRNYIAFICLKILSLKDDKLCQELEKEEFKELEDSIFEYFPGKKGILINTLKLISDVDGFLETYVISTNS